MKFFVAIVMLACAAAAADVPELTPSVKAATDFHNAAHAAAKTVALGGAAPSFFQPDAPDVHFVKQAHLAQLNYETVRNTGYPYGVYPYGVYPYAAPYAARFGAYPYAYGAYP